MKTLRQFFITAAITFGLYSGSAIADGFMGPSAQVKNQNQHQNQHQYKIQQGSDNGQGNRYQYNKQYSGSNHSSSGFRQQFQTRQGKH